MSNITLQLTYDSSFIDFVVNKDDQKEKIKSIDLKLSLLSSGNSYESNLDINQSNFDTLRDYLLPWRWSKDDIPSHIRIWKAGIDSSKYVDVEIVKPITVNSDDFDAIQNYFGDNFKSQVYKEYKDGENVIFKFKSIQWQIDKEKAEEINIDENYTTDSTSGKSQAVIAQMAQKLYPYNEHLGFLYLVNTKIEKEEDIKFLNDENAKFISFPISTKQGSIWEYQEINPNPVKDNFFIIYKKNRKIGDDNTEINCKAFTKSTSFPKQNYPELPKSGNDAEHVVPINDVVTLRKDGKFNGKVKIEVEQDNDWQVGFTDVLTNLLDIRDFIFNHFLTKENVEKIKNENNFSEDVKMIKKLLFSPFTFIKHCISSIHDDCKNSIISAGNQIKYEQEIKKMSTTFNTIKINIEDFHAKENDKEALLESILEIIPFPFKDEKIYSEVDEINELYEIYHKLSETSVQQTLLNILFNFKYDKLEPIKNNGKSYILNSDEENVLSIWKKKDDNSADLFIDSETMFELDTIDCYKIFFQLLLSKGYTANNKQQVLKFLLEKTEGFSKDDLNKNIPKLIDSIYNDKSTIKDSFKFPEDQSATFNIKIKCITDDLLIRSIKEEIESLYEELKAPSKDQLPIRIQIGNPNQLAPKNDNEQDDLADELSGYVLLSTRSEKMNINGNYGNWKYHNWALAGLSTLKKEKKEENKLNTPFLVPSYLPEHNEVQQLFLEISNESASLVANLEGLNKDSITAEGTDKNIVPQIDYLLPENDFENNPYALRYGYYYNFAAFAVLNSGVLPEPLRKVSLDSSRVFINQFKDRIATSDIPVPEKSFHFLRTKEVSPPTIIIKDPNDTITNYPKDYPKELNPLYYELFSEERKRSELKAPIILGSPYIKNGNVISKGFNEDFSIKIKKPRTSFWDCYSFDWAEFDPSKENKYKIKRMNEDGSETTEFLDPSVSDKIWMEVEVLNKINETNSEGEIKSQFINYNVRENDEDPSNLLSEVKLNFQINTFDNSDISINKFKLYAGKIYKVSFFNLIDKKYFDEKIKDKENLELKFDPKRNFEKELKTIEEVEYYKVSSEYLIFETAFNYLQDSGQNKKLWENLLLTEVLKDKEDNVFSNTDYEKYKISNSVKLLLNSKEYPGYSRVKVQHQKLDWQGRQPNIDMGCLGVEEKLNPTLSSSNNASDIDQTSEAMKLDAWWNSERPHDTSVISYSNILAHKSGRDNLLHEYKNVLDNHAMLLKYTVTLHNRYEALGENYAKDIIESKLKIGTRDANNPKYYPWKFYLKKSKRTEQLPAPSVRFYIPLTGSIKEANDSKELNIADVMLVLDDVWYREAGLAQKFTLGIKKTKDYISESLYPEAGYDPTLSITKTKALTSSSETVSETEILKNEIDYEIVKDRHIKGPLGFTFDFVATNPKVNSTSFVISGNSLATYIGDGYKDKNDPFYPMFKLAVRSEVTPELLEVKKEENISEEAFNKEREKIAKTLISKWSGTQWVQFLKAVDSFVPDQWRNEVRLKGTVEINNQTNLSQFSVFGDTFHDHHNWYLILSTIESNIGGLPVEKYYDTFRIDNGLKKAHKEESLKDFKGGYARIMVVRKSKDYEDQTKRDHIWDELFGEKENDEEKTKIKNDNVLAMPIITERIPVKFINS